MSVTRALPLIVLLAAANGCARAHATAGDFTEAGDRYARDGRYSAAVIEFKNAIQRDPRFAAAHAHLAATYELMGRIDDAYREYANALALDANDSRSRLASGRLLFDAHMYQEAQIRAEQVLDRDPHNADALVDR